ncbi:MAG: hypothetical protein AB7I45_01525 [Planctomycetota bacterium]
MREATGPTTVDILAAVDAFRSDLGGSDNGTASGSQAAGRREVDWEVPDADAAPLFLASDFYNTSSTRGLVVTGPRGLELQASADASNPTNTTAELGHVNNTYPTAFAPFSGARLVAPVDGNVVELGFFVPGTGTPAVVQGVGVVVTDVDVAAASKLAFYDPFGRLLVDRAFLTTPGIASHSFLGVTTQDAVIARVVITLGNAALGPDDVTQGGAADIVVLDNVIYDEPQAVP